MPLPFPLFPFYPGVCFSSGFSAAFHAKLRTHSCSLGDNKQSSNLNPSSEATVLLKGIFRTKNLDDILSALGDEENAIFVNSIIVMETT